jgi:hypothetical protein
MHIRRFWTMFETLKYEDCSRDNGVSLDSNYCNSLSEFRSHLMKDLDGGPPCILDGANPILNCS